MSGFTRALNPARQRLGLIGLGANLGDPAAQIAAAVAALRAQRVLRVRWVSPLFATAPLGCPGEQPDYLNGVLCLETAASPEFLLGLLHGLEARAGRDRDLEGYRGARPLDLDLLSLGDCTRTRPGLTVPHPRLEERGFVLGPLCAVDPTWRLPSGRTAAEALAALGAPPAPSPALPREAPAPALPTERP